ncbi:hypothetical protein [Brevibacterium marinum]|uniref:Uncharacterized protein n=1 Tax=Brevibacterium marinum TaxID=418643 RepID=A0A846S644_9MICO|nr:hypothetical protein [Brevibacterium marinum]NJC56307.1 hypothetical protein [Brevibacterium marinum]
MIALALWLVYVRTPHVAAASRPSNRPSDSGAGGDHRSTAVPFAFGFGLETAASPLVPVIGLAVIVGAQSLIGLRTSRL